MGKKIKIRAQEGSTMSNLAEILGTTVEELKKYNNLDSNIIKSGQEFSWETDDVEGIKTRLSKVQNRLQQKRQAIIDAENKKKADENAKRNMQWIESKKQDYGDLTQHQIRDYQNFVKSGKGKTIADFKAYKEKESKSAQSTRDLALKAGQGIVGMAGITSLGTTVLPKLLPNIITYSKPVFNASKNIAKDMIYHPIENFVAPQLLSNGVEKVIDYTNDKNLTNFTDAQKDVISTTTGFMTGKFGIDLLRNRISKGLLNSGKGYLLESGSRFSNFLNNQLKNKYTSLKGVHFNIPKNLSFNSKDAIKTSVKEITNQLKNLGIYTGSNFTTYGLPELIPGMGQYASHSLTDKSLGENLELYTGINSTIGDMLTEGILSSGADAYKHAFEYTKASMSGGKKGFKDNWDYFWDHAGRTDNDFNYTKKHPLLGRLNTIRRLLTLNPGHNYQMAIEANPGKNAGTQNYTPYKASDVSPLEYLRYWFSSDPKHLGNKLEEKGSIMLGNRDLTTGNTMEQLAKSLSLNDGRFENGRRMKIVTSSGADQTLSGSKFYNMHSGKYEPIFINSQINPNISQGYYSSRNNVFLNMGTSKTGAKVGTMLDIDGHNELKIQTPDGKFGYAHIDVVGPGSGATGGGVLTKTLSNINSKEIDPVVSITLSGNRKLNKSNSKSGINHVVKGMNTEFSDIDDFVLTLENMDSPNIVERFGKKDASGNYLNKEYETLVNYRKSKEQSVLANKEYVDEFKKGNLTDAQRKGLEKRRDNASQKKNEGKYVQIGSKTYQQAINWVNNPNKPKTWNPKYWFNQDRRSFNKVADEVLSKKSTKPTAHMGIQTFGV